MIRTFRAFFLRLALREKVLLVAFLAVGVAIWASSYADRFGRFWQAQKTTGAVLAEQELFLQNQAAIEAAAEKAAEQLVPARTLNELKLFTTIRQLVADAGLEKNFRTDQAPPAVTNGALTVHTLSFQIQNADWAALKKFYLALEEKTPYIALKKTTLQPNRANPNQMTFVATVSAVQR